MDHFRSPGRVPIPSLVVLLLTACVGSGERVPFGPENPGDAPTDFAGIQQLLSTTCAEQCHHGGAAPKGLSFEPHRVWKQLVGVPSVEVPGLLRVDPGHPSKSYLIVKVRPTDPRRVGSRMPRGGPRYLTGAQVRALERWITAGAGVDWTADQPVPDAGSEPSLGDEAADVGGVD